MRVISGSARGRKLKTIEGLETRPTLDRIKETLFNMINFDIPNCEFLDLFSGSGSIGIEALSRGAEEVVFVESNMSCKEIIFENINSINLWNNWKYEKGDVLTAITSLGNQNKKFDIIYMDPPYEMDLYEPTLKQILKGDLLKKEGYIIMEHKTNLEFSIPSQFEIFRQKEYKVTTLTFLGFKEEI